MEVLDVLVTDLVPLVVLLPVLLVLLVLLVFCPPLLLVPPLLLDPPLLSLPPLLALPLFELDPEVDCSKPSFSSMALVSALSAVLFCDLRTLASLHSRSGGVPTSAAVAVICKRPGPAMLLSGID